MRNFPRLKAPRIRKECDNTETCESNKAPSQPIGWNLGRRQWRLTTDDRRTQISEPSPNSVENRKSSEDQTMSDKSLDGGQVKSTLVTIINLVINSREWSDTCGKPSTFTSNIATKFNGNQPIHIVE
jgi:hypothetical protein